MCYHCVVAVASTVVTYIKVCITCNGLLCKDKKPVNLVCKLVVEHTKFGLSLVCYITFMVS